MQNTSKQDLGNLHTTEHEILNEHAKEISRYSQISEQSSCAAAHIALKKEADGLRALVHFTQHAFSNYFLALLTSPQTILIDPFGTVFAFIALPLIHIGLLLVQIAFLLSRWTGAAQFCTRLSRDYGSGLGVVNMVSKRGIV